MDLEALLGLEHEAFSSDRISRRAMRRLLDAANATVLVAEVDDKLAGYALVLFRRGSTTARLYSIAVARHAAGRRVGATLLAAVEQAAMARGATRLRLEVNAANDPAVRLYRKAGYRLFGRHAQYYEDKGDALRFEKRLVPDLRGLRDAPPYFHQTTDFTCGPACMMMALAWADPSFRPGPAYELKLWREATTIFMTTGPGGCDPYGLAVTLKRHGLEPQIHASHGGPYFLDTVRSEDKRRVMRLAQDELRRDAEALNIPIHLAPLDESALMEAFDTDAVAIVLVSGYGMVRRNVPHWVFAFGCERRYVLLHDPAAATDAHGHATAAETYALPLGEFSHFARFGRDDLRVSILIRKGFSQ